MSPFLPHQHQQVFPSPRIEKNMREVFPSHVDKDHCNKEGRPNGVYSHKDVAKLCDKIPQIIAIAVSSMYLIPDCL
jgi:hypothetical protein